MVVLVLVLVAEKAMAMARVVVEMIIVESLVDWNDGQWGGDDGCMATRTKAWMAAIMATGDCTMAALGLGWSFLPLL
jgi:hypothetical protein